ncbi:hypothetical protein ACFL0M_15345, partial [Thermodesulfobacteriota bacterium]
SEASMPPPKLNYFAVHAKTPKSIREKLIPAFKRVINNPELVKKWIDLGLYHKYLTPAEFTNRLEKNWNIYSAIINKLGLKKR